MFGFAVGIAVSAAAGFNYVQAEINAAAAALQKTVAGVKGDLASLAATQQQVQHLAAEVEALQQTAARKGDVAAVARDLAAAKVGPSSSRGHHANQPAPCLGRARHDAVQGPPARALVATPAFPPSPAHPRGRLQHKQETWQSHEDILVALKAAQAGQT